MFYDHLNQKVGEIGPVVLNSRGIPGEPFFTTDLAEGRKINLLDRYTLTSASLIPDDILAARKQSAAFPDMIFPRPEELASIPENITVYHTITSKGLFEQYSYVIEDGEYAYLLSFYGTEISRPIFDRIAENITSVQEAP